MAIYPGVSANFGKNTVWSGVRASVLAVALAGSASATGVELTTVVEDGRVGPCTVDGVVALAEQPVTMASTFKVFLAWAALEEGVVRPETRRPVADRHVPGAPREITLLEAMFYSSNDYFIGLLPTEALARLPARLVESGLADAPPPRWLEGPPREICSGGSLRVTPRRNHQFMLRLALGHLTSSPAIQAQLEAVCLWPPREGPLRVYGKTGTLTGAVWFNGFARDPATQRLVVRTIFIPGTVSQRPLAIRRFYEGIGLPWQDAWSRWLD
jgi:beta-lactamase class D